MENDSYISDTYVCCKDVYESSEPDATKAGGVLRVIKGPVAEWSKLNRNSRMYSEKLWDKVLDSPYVKEQLKFNTLYGEANHPESRYEVDFSRVSHSITDMWKVPEKNQIYATINILDTPLGNILNTLYEAGGTLGYSSRAGGVLHQRKDFVEVDEDTFNFITFDAVPYPSVVAARPGVITEGVETLGKESLPEDVHKKICNIINESGSANRETLKDFIYSIEGYDMSEEKKLFESSDKTRKPVKKNVEVQKSSDETTLSLLKESTLQINKLKASNNALKSDNNSLRVENEALKKSLGDSLVEVTKLVNESKETDKDISMMERQNNDTIEVLESKIKELESIISDKDFEIESLEGIKEAFEIVKRENKGLKTRTVNESSYTDVEVESLKKKHEEQIQEAYKEISKLVEEADKKNSLIETMKNQIEDLNESCETMRAERRTAINESTTVSETEMKLKEMLTENRKLNNEIESLTESLNAEEDRKSRYEEELISVVSSNYNLASESVKRRLPRNFTKSDIYEVCEEMSIKNPDTVDFSSIVESSFDNTNATIKTDNNQSTSPKVGNWFSSNNRRGL